MKAKHIQIIQIAFTVAAVVLLMPALAEASDAGRTGTALDTTADQFSSLLSGPIAKVAGIGAIVVGGVMFAFGGDMGGGLKALAGAAIGIGIIVSAATIVGNFTSGSELSYGVQMIQHFCV